MVRPFKVWFDRLSMVLPFKFGATGYEKKDRVLELWSGDTYPDTKPERTLKFKAAGVRSASV